MENFNRSSDLFSIEVDEHARVTFHEMARWTKFLAILGFIGLGLMIAGGFFALAFSAAMGPSSPVTAIGTTSIVLVYLIIMVACIYPFYGMLKYSTNMKAALATQDKTRFNTAIVYLKNVFKYYGIISIIILGIYGLLLIIGILISSIR